ncbi:MAG: right-handed parallel beta-helix repeat-containing protein [Nostoc sp. NMS7]|uniref:beta strand repeat-containing protein n=1 Tax=Nostoc sp. NMS7 TaxID=2815391 RepID=UPI0025F6DE08|nr:right-handed parallel beta-helix repeat-containing protein [Nostoc sp. NMS7]MBN3950062.1 right-handed parallel beta-helix repeat-containing protein [Nostoc sp. NMS7]
MSTFTVTNTDNSGAGSLRQQILNADLAGGTNIINFGGLFSDGLAHTINLTGSGLSITDNLTIEGTNASLLTIKDDSADRVFHIGKGATSAINGLTITNTYNGYNGTPGGGGIYNEGTLTLNNSIITGNTAYYNAIDFYGNTLSAGGGIYNTGSLTVNYSTISNNSAGDILSSNSDGGGIYNTGSLTVYYSNITGNIAGHYGGGIYSDQDLKTGIKPNSVSVNYSTISHNSSTESGGYGGGIYLHYGMLSHNTVTNNSAGSNGGGIYLYDGQVNYNTVTNNSAGDYGGGIYLYDGQVNYSTITNNSAGEIGGGISLSQGTVNYSSISGNSSQSDGGGIVGSGGFTVNYSSITDNTALQGGGIYVTDNGGIVSHSIISGNTAKNLGGGIFYSGLVYSLGYPNVDDIVVSDSTLSNNQARIGAAVYNDGTLTLAKSTISNNKAQSGGGIYNDGALILSNSNLSNNQAHFGGGIYNDGTLTVGNSIIRVNKAFGIELSSGQEESGDGAGIYNILDGTARLDYSTVACNFDTPLEDSTKFIKVDNLVGKFINIGSFVRV